jgi:hypothetical protein
VHVADLLLGGGVDALEGLAGLGSYVLACVKQTNEERCV